MSRDSGQDRVAVVYLANHQGTDQGEQGVAWQVMPHTSYLSQRRETHPDGCSDVGPHGDVGVQSEDDQR